MRPPDFTNILDNDFPPVDRQKVRPSGRHISVIEHRRTVDQTGDEVGVFNTSTRPTYDEVQLLIDQALELTLTDLPDHLPESSYPRILQAITLKTAWLIEIGYYGEQYKTGPGETFDQQYDKLIASIEMVNGGAGVGRRVDTPMMRGSMAQFDPDLPIPPPRIMPKMPFPIDGNPYSEGQ